MPNEGASHAWTGMRAGSDEWKVRVVQPAPEPIDHDAVPFSELDDAALVRASIAGHPAAFDVVVERHRRHVYQICYRFVGSHEDASDLAQETFVRAWRGLDRFKGHAAFATWLYRIAVNVCLNRVAVRKPPFEPLEADRLIDPRHDDPGRHLIAEERATAVRRAILALPTKQRATLILRAYHELSHREIADILGSSVGAVKANFFHALANLKRILGSEP